MLRIIFTRRALECGDLAPLCALSPAQSFSNARQWRAGIGWDSGLYREPRKDPNETSTRAKKAAGTFLSAR